MNCPYAQCSTILNRVSLGRSQEIMRVRSPHGVAIEQSPGTDFLIPRNSVRKTREYHAAIEDRRPAREGEWPGAGWSDLFS